MDLNKCFYAGHLTKDIELVNAKSTIAKSTLAVNRKYTVEGKDKTETAFIQFVAYGKLGDLLAKHLKKGSPAFFIGRSVTESWEKDGVKHSKLVFIVEEFKFVGKKESTDSSENSEEPQSIDGTEEGEAPF